VQSALIETSNRVCFAFNNAFYGLALTPLRHLSFCKPLLCLHLFFFWPAFNMGPNRYGLGCPVGLASSFSLRLWLSVTQKTRSGLQEIQVPTQNPNQNSLPSAVLGLRTLTNLQNVLPRLLLRTRWLQSRQHLYGQEGRQGRESEWREDHTHSTEPAVSW